MIKKYNKIGQMSSPIFKMITSSVIALLKKKSRATEVQQFSF